MCLEIISQIDGRGYQKVISLFVERAAFHDEVNPSSALLEDLGNVIIRTERNWKLDHLPNTLPPPDSMSHGTSSTLYSGVFFPSHLHIPHLQIGFLHSACPT